jgi:hypothetical protein
MELVPTQPRRALPVRPVFVVMYSDKKNVYRPIWEQIAGGRFDESRMCKLERLWLWSSLTRRHLETLMMSGDVLEKHCAIVLPLSSI